MLAYTLAEGGADWQTVHVRDLGGSPGSRRSRPVDAVLRARLDPGRPRLLLLALSGAAAGKTYEAALSGHALYYHRVGTPQSEDVLIFERPDLPTWFVHGTVSDDGRYLLIALNEGATNSNRLYVVDMIEAPRRTCAHRSAR